MSQSKTGLNRSGSGTRALRSDLAHATPGAPRTFRAATLREALAQVRRELGGEAIIVDSRELVGRGWLGLPWGRRSEVEVVASVGTLTPVAPASGVSTELDEPLRRLHAMVGHLVQAGRIEHLLVDLPTALVPSYARLIDLEWPEPLARRVIREVAAALEPEELARPEVIDASIREAAELCVAVAPPVAVVPGVRRVVALVGPTGVGKTTTVAKLAARLKLGQGVRVGLVAADTYRIAAVNQLRAYAEILDVPLAVASSPMEMARAIESLGPVAVVFVDTAGRSPRDDDRLKELDELLAAARPDELHLVLSAAGGESSLRRAAERFAALRPDRLIFTKLDETEAPGALLALSGQSWPPISYLGTGQAVPEDLEAADRSRLARLVVGADRIPIGSTARRRVGAA